MGKNLPKYTATYDANVEPIYDISTLEYQKWLEKHKDYIEENGLLETYASLSSSDKSFLDRIKNLSPKHKVIAIEKYVRSIGYYDMDNKEVIDIKKGKSPEEVVRILRKRMLGLKGSDPSLQDKQIAGVCADFTLYTTNLLRHAEIPTAARSGFFVDSQVVTTKHAHADVLSFYPTESLELRTVVVDPTPDGTNSLARVHLEGFQLKTLEERDFEAELEERRRAEQVEKEDEARIVAERVQERKAILDDLDRGFLARYTSSQDTLVEALKSLFCSK